MTGTVHHGTPAWHGAMWALALTATSAMAQAADPLLPQPFRLPADFGQEDAGLPDSGRWTDAPLLAYSGVVVPPMESPRVKHTDEPPPPAGTRKWEHVLPFWGQKVIDRGIDLPNPYNLGFSLYLSDEHRDLSKLGVSINDNPLSDASFVEFPDSRIHTLAVQYQVGAWLFPFLNVFGILGYSEGGGDIDIRIPGDELLEFFHIQGCERPAGSPLRPALCDQTLTGTAEADFKGYTYGAGLTLAGAYKDFFFSLPVQYVISDVSMSEKKGKTWNITPRIGWNIHPKSGGLVTAYAGGTYMISDIHIEGSFQFDTSGTPIGQVTSMNYSITVEPTDPWNYLVGAHWMPNKTWSFLGEIGFGGSRENYLMNVFYRF